MEIINAAPGDRINIGRKGEHLARRVQFDLTAWAETYGDGRAELLYQRPGDLHAYPIAAQRQGNLLLWDITNVDTAQAGKTGRAEIRYYVGDTLVILEISYIQVEQTLEITDKIPAMPKADWFEQVLEQVRRVEAPVTNPPIINGETGTWMIYDRETEQYENTGYPATGQDGADGKDGLNGRDGRDGKDGQDGAPGKDGLNGQDGAPGKDGQDGAPGKDGAQGQRGTGILKVSTSPSGYTTAIGSYTPKYRIALSTVKTQTGVTEVLIGDVIQYSYYQYRVDHIDSSYAYISATRTSLRGAAGTAGTSATHSWDGTTLTITSASGTSSADLKGEKGDPGENVQADFEENDPEQESYVRGRTHWKEVVGEDREIVPQQTATFSALGWAGVEGVADGMKEGVKYVAVIGGLEIEGRCRKHDLELYIGNGHLLDSRWEDTGEGFCINALGGIYYQLTLKNPNATIAGSSLKFEMRSVQEVTWHKLEHGYLPDDLGSAIDYNDLKNTPCSIRMGELLPETVIEVDPDTGEGILSEFIEVKDGDLVVVQWNGVEYPCTAVETHDLYEGIPVVLLGNMSTVTGDASSDEPFLILLFDAPTTAVTGAGGGFYALDQSTSVTLSISGKVVEKLDERFLPEMPRKMTVRITKNEEDEWVADKTYDEVDIAILLGYDVCAIAEQDELQIYMSLAYRGPVGVRFYAVLPWDESTLHHASATLNANGVKYTLSIQHI